MFDGQGYAIKNLVVNSSSFRFVGIFGFLNGVTITNFMIDSSCTFEEKYNTSSNSWAGSAVGKCSSTMDDCVISNVVNMGNVIFSGKNGIPSVGGIIGECEANASNCYVINCANYGTITLTGNVANNMAGGVIGKAYSRSTHIKAVYVQNCLNYGTLNYKGSQNKSNFFIWVEL